MEKCTEKGLPGYKYSDSKNAKCYTYFPNNEKSKKRAREQARDQLQAIIMAFKKKEEEEKKKTKAKRAATIQAFGAVITDGGRATEVSGVQPEPPSWMEKRDMALRYGRTYGPEDKGQFPIGGDSWEALNAGRSILIDPNGFIVDVWDAMGNHYNIMGERITHIGGGTMIDTKTRLPGANDELPLSKTKARPPREKRPMFEPYGPKYKSPVRYPEPKRGIGFRGSEQEYDAFITACFARISGDDIQEFARRNNLSTEMARKALENEVMLYSGEYLDEKRLAQEDWREQDYFEVVKRALQTWDTKNWPIAGGTCVNLSLKKLLRAAVSLGDLLSMLRKIKDPTRDVEKAITAVEGMVAKYDEGAKTEEVTKSNLNKIMALLKKVPKPTEENPRTRVLKAVGLLEEMMKQKVSGSLLQASILTIARTLAAVEEPTDEVKKAIELANKLAKGYEEGAPEGYGHIVSVEGMTKLLELLQKIEEKPDPVVKAITALKKLLEPEKETMKPELPAYGVSKLESSEKPGVYKAKLIKAGKALNGLNWSADALKEAFENKLFESIPVNVISYTGEYGPVDYHLPIDSTLSGQIVGNQVGFTKDTYWDVDEDTGYGFVYITDHNRRELIDAMLKEGLDAPGLSLYADGLTDDDDLVTKINNVASMDMVTFPAAGGGILSEALTASITNWGKEMLMKKMRSAVAKVGADIGIAPTRSDFPGREFQDPERMGVSDTKYFLESRSKPFDDELRRDMRRIWTDLFGDLKAGVELENYYTGLRDEILDIWAKRMDDSLNRLGKQPGRALTFEDMIAAEGRTFPKDIDELIKVYLTRARYEGRREVGGAKLPGAVEANGGGGEIPNLAREAVIHDNYILINDYLGEGFAEANPALITTLQQIAANYLRNNPDTNYEDLCIFTFKILEMMYPRGGGRPKQWSESRTTGGTMKENARLSTLEHRMSELNERVAEADTGQIIDQKLQASKLPAEVQALAREQLNGKRLSAAEIDGYLSDKQRTCDALAKKLQDTAAITLEGGSIPVEGEDDTVKGALERYLKSQA